MVNTIQIGGNYVQYMVKLIYTLIIYQAYLTTYFNCVNHLDCCRKSCQILVVQIPTCLQTGDLNAIKNFREKKECKVP